MKTTSGLLTVLLAAILLMSIGGCSKKDADQDINSRLAKAVVKRDLDNLRMLLKQGANPNTIDEKGWLVLSQAANIGPTTDSVKVLISAGANVNAVDADGTTPLMHAAFADFRLPQSMVWRTSNVTVLLENGADISAKNDRGRSALYYAARGGALSMCKLLIEAGADPDTKTIEGESPLDIAEKRGHADIVKFLKEPHNVTN
jgi:ankyrin repeat protein